MRTPARGVVALVAGVVAIPLVVAWPPPVSGEEARPSYPPAASDRISPADFKATLDENDEIAALDAVRIALSEVGDGNTYVWYRRHGRLSGIVQPTSSFKDRSGRVCRHLTLIMTTGGYTARAEGIACRLDDGRWQLEG